MQELMGSVEDQGAVWGRGVPRVLMKVREMW